MKLKDLRKIVKALESLEDDYDVKLRTSEEIPQKELDEMSYPYPFVHEKYSLDDDINNIQVGYSSKLVLIGIIKDED